MTGAGCIGGTATGAGCTTGAGGVTGAGCGAGGTAAGSATGVAAVNVTGTFLDDPNSGAGVLVDAAGVDCGSGCTDNRVNCCSIWILSEGSLPPLVYDKTKSRRLFLSFAEISLLRTDAKTCITACGVSKENAPREEPELYICNYTITLIT